ncbi:ribonuclease H-like domain-containing protein [Tanacetum coccineum]
MVVIWNPTVRKSVGIVIHVPEARRYIEEGYIIVGFGVCPDTSDPKLVFVDGVIYFHAYDDVFLDVGVRSNFVISFDLKSEKFGEVCLPERLVHTPDLNVTKVNELLGLLEYYDEVEGKWSDNWVLGFRNNGEVVMDYKESRIAVYEPLSGHINDVGINGKLLFQHKHLYDYEDFGSTGFSYWS